MEPFITIGLALIGSLLFYIWDQNRKDQKEVEEIMERVEQLEAEKKKDAAENDAKANLGDTRQLLVHTLKKLGCEHEIVNETYVRFNYQGETFIAETSEDSAFVTIRDPWWHDLSMDGELDDFARLQKAINHINSIATCTVLYTMDTEERRIGVHSSKNMIFIPQIPHLENYLTATLDYFFKVQRAVLVEIERYKAAECGKTSS